MKKEETLKIEIPPMKRTKINVEIEGTSPLIVHRFGEKVKKQMLDKQQKKANKGKEAKDPIADFVHSLHIMNGADRNEIIADLKKAGKEPGDDVASFFKNIPLGFPSGGFKKASISACRNIDGVPMTLARGAYHIIEDSQGLSEIKYERLIIREDSVKLQRNIADIRFRGELQNWSATLHIDCNPMALSPEQVCNLIDMSGFAVDIGESRPERGGSNGMFMLKR